MSSITTTEARSALRSAGWSPDEYSIYQRGAHVTVALGLSRVQTSAANGSNAAGALLEALKRYGLDVTPDNWEHLLAGEESTVTRRPGRPSRGVEVKTRLYQEEVDLVEGRATAAGVDRSTMLAQLIRAQLHTPDGTGCLECGAPGPADDLCDDCAASVELAAPDEEQ
jgi:hypothetical protein